MLRNKYDLKAESEVVKQSNGILLIDKNGTVILNPTMYDSNKKYYKLVYTIDGKTYDKEMDIKEPNGAMVPKVVKEAICSGVPIEVTLVHDESKERFEIDSSMGLRVGLNEIEVEVNGVPKTLTIKAHKDSKNIAYLFKDSDYVKIKSVKSLGNYEYDGFEKGKPYVVTIQTKKGKFVKIVSPVDSKIDVNDIIKEDEIKEVQDVTIKEFILEEFISNISDISQYESSNDIFSEHKYGGNQSDIPYLLDLFMNGESKTIIDTEKGKILYDLINKYFGEISNEDRKKIAENYANSGCMYMAVANAFATYMGSIDGGSEIFKERFGYDLIVKDGDNSSYNLEAIAFEIYLKSLRNMYADKSIDEMVSHINGVGNQSFKEKIVDFFAHKGIVIDSELKKYSLSQLNSSEEEYEKKVKLDMLEDLLNNNGFHILCANDFSMEIIDGEVISFNSYDKALENATASGNKAIHVSEHAMVITGIDTDGNLIVSSWSEKYKIPLLDSINNYQANIGGHFNVNTISFTILDNE